MSIISVQNLEQQIFNGIVPFRPQLGMLQILQSSIGCANSCEMCSQGASPGVTRITRDSLSHIMGALKRVTEINWEEGATLGANRSHKPGVIFPYLDTDVGSDCNLGYIIETLGKNFGCKTRISTVGFSRHNSFIQAMHTDIAQRLKDFIEGFRISLTPYTSHFFSEDYPKDISNLINTYLPLIEDQGVGRDLFACELRFPPFIQLGDVAIGLFGGRFFIRSATYCFIADERDIVYENVISKLQDRKVKFDRPGVRGKIYSGDGFASKDLDHIISTYSHRTAHIYHVKNIDGDVFAVNPLADEEGFHAIHFLPKTKTRKESGVIDSTRPFMNAMIEYKRLRRCEVKGKLEGGNIEDFLSFFTAYIGTHAHSQALLNFWKNEVLNIILVTSKIIRGSRISDDAFFDPKFLVDTGHIVNQGRAKNIFQGLVSQSDEPITINEMKGYAEENSIGTSRGIIYRLAPVPVNSGGLRNLIRGKSGLVLSGLHHKGLQPITEKTHFIPADIETIFTPRQKILAEFGIPGLSLNSKYEL